MHSETCRPHLLLSGPSAVAAASLSPTTTRCSRTCAATLIAGPHRPLPSHLQRRSTHVAAARTSSAVSMPCAPTWLLDHSASGPPPPPQLQLPGLQIFSLLHMSRTAYSAVHPFLTLANRILPCACIVVGFGYFCNPVFLTRSINTNSISAVNMFFPVTSYQVLPCWWPAPWACLPSSLGDVLEVQGLCGHLRRP